MPTAFGNIHATSGTKFIATFNINGINFTFSGSIEPSVPGFSSSKATISFGSVNDLSGVCTWSGQIGTSTVTMTFNNNVKITAPISPPIIPAIPASGSAC